MDRKAEFFGLFSSVRGKSAIAKAAKDGRLVQRSRLEANLNTMLSEGRLWGRTTDENETTYHGALHDASFYVESGGELLRKFKLDSLYDRFGGASMTFTGDETPHNQFAKIFMPALKSLCAIVLQRAFDKMRADGEDTPAFDLRDKNDQQLALEVLGEYYKFGISIQKPKVVKVASEKFLAAGVAADALLADLFYSVK